MMNNKALKTLYLYNGIFVFAGGMFGPLYAIFVGGIDKSIFSVSLTWFAFLFSTTIFLLFVEKFGDSLEEKEYLLMGGFLIRALVWFLFPFVSTLFWLIIMQILLGLGEALGTPSYDAIFAEHLDKNKHVKEYTEWKLISNIVSSFAILLGGLLVNYVGFSILFFIMGMMALVSFFGVLWTPRKVL